AERVRAAVAEIPGLAFECFDDPTKMLIAVDGAGWNGYAAAAALRRLGVQVEMGTARHVLALATFGDTDETLAKLCRALEKLAQEAPEPGGPDAPWDEVEIAPAAALRRATEPLMRPRAAALAP